MTRMAHPEAATHGVVAPGRSCKLPRSTSMSTSSHVEGLFAPRAPHRHPPAGESGGRTLVKWKAFAHRRLAVTVALIAAAAPLPQVDPDGTSNQSLRDQLDPAARAYTDAKGRPDVPHAKPGQLEQQL